jgi:hypothetical protein
MYLATHRHGLVRQADQAEIKLFFDSTAPTTRIPAPFLRPADQRMPYWTTPLRVETHGFYGPLGNRTTVPDCWHWKVDEPGTYTVRLSGEIRSVIGSVPAEGTVGFAFFSNDVDYNANPGYPAADSPSTAPVFTWDFGFEQLRVRAARNIRRTIEDGGGNNFTIGPGGPVPEPDPPPSPANTVGIHYPVLTGAITGTNTYVIEFDTTRRLTVTENQLNFRIQPYNANQVDVNLTITKDALS